MTLSVHAFKHGEKINGHGVVIMDELREKYPDKFIKSGQMDWKWFEKDIRPNHTIYIRRDKNSFSCSYCDNETVLEAVAKMMMVTAVEDEDMRDKAYGHVKSAIECMQKARK